MSNYSQEDAIIFRLKFEIVEGDCDTIDAISNFLQIKEESIIKTIENIFQNQKNILLEEIIEIVKQQNFNNSDSKTKK